MTGNQDRDGRPHGGRLPLPRVKSGTCAAFRARVIHGNACLAALRAYGTVFVAVFENRLSKPELLKAVATNT